MIFHQSLTMQYRLTNFEVDGVVETHSSGCAVFKPASSRHTSKKQKSCQSLHFSLQKLAEKVSKSGRQNVATKVLVKYND